MTPSQLSWFFQNRSKIRVNKSEADDLWIVDLVQLATEFARDWRNRRLAHNDLELALDTSVEPLVDASKKHVDGALKALADTLNAVAAHYLDSGTIFDLYRARRGGSSLIYVLHEGVTAQEKHEKLLQQGKIPEWNYPKDL